MSKQSTRDINKSLLAISDALSLSDRLPKVQTALDAFAAVAQGVRSAYQSITTLTVTDTTDADLDAFFAATGELALASAAGSVKTGDVFTVQGAGDTTDNALAAAKAAGMLIDAQITVTDTTDATIAALTAATGELGIDIGAMQVRDGFRFRVLGTGDTTNNALQTAKGSAPAANDVFEVTTSGAGVTYIGNAATVASGDLFEVSDTSTSAVSWLGSETVSLSALSFLGRGA